MQIPAPMPAAQTDLFGKPQPYSCGLFEIKPEMIWVKQTDSGSLARLQAEMSKAVWRPAPGRKLAFEVMHGETLIGLIFLASPVINLTDRDKHLGLSSDPKQKGRQLREVMDISVCVSAQPLGWHWNLGKLCAMLATTLNDFFRQRYGDELKHLVTTSLWGRGTQYNRVYKFLGYTKGHGHEHISDERYCEMMRWLKENGHEIPSCRFGAGSNPRMRRIAAYRKHSGDKAVTLKHGHKRGIYYHEAIDSSKRSEVVIAWFKRWGLPRYEKTRHLSAPYINGLSNAGEVLETRPASSQEMKVQDLPPAPLSNPCQQ